MNANKSPITGGLISSIIFASASISTIAMVTVFNVAPQLLPTVKTAPIESNTTTNTTTNSDTAKTMTKEEITNNIDLDLFLKRIQEFQMEEQKKAQEEQAKADEEAKKNIAKKPKPEVELFVMSHCPYGTQIEKGMLPVLETLGDKIDFKLKFCDYAMHDKKELDEQLNQYCIQKNEPQNLAKYLTCFLKDGNTTTCIDEAGLNKDQLTACVKETDQNYKVTENYNNKAEFKGQFPSFNVFKEDNAKYNIGGSPSLVLNGQEISSGRDAASLLETICLGFDNQPEECKKTLSETPPAPGFGFDGSGSNTEAGCGS